MPVNIKATVARALEQAALNYGKPSTRVGGFHASSAGKCYRRLIIEQVLPGCVHPITSRQASVFNIGHIFDKYFKDAMEMGTKSDDIFMLSPFSTITKIEDSELVVVGEPDVVLLDMKSKIIHILDAKSAAHDSFYYKKKDGASIMNSLQVCTYADSSEIQGLIDALGDSWRVKCWIVYLDKDDISHHVASVNSDLILTARAYWREAAKMLGIWDRQQMLPGAFPQEDWECGYCPLYPALEEQDWKNKTQIKTARSTHKASCALDCARSDEDIWISRSKEKI